MTWALDPELLDLQEQMRARAMYPKCFDVKTICLPAALSISDSAGMTTMGTPHAVAQGSPSCQPGSTVTRWRKTHICVVRRRRISSDLAITPHRGQRAIRRLVGDSLFGRLGIPLEALPVLMRLHAPVFTRYGR